MPAGAGFAQDEAPLVQSIRIEGAITTVTTDYLDRALDRAVEGGADALLIELNTPGGSVDAMLQMGGRMLNAGIPVLCWVGPDGAQAASAGTFIVLAAHAAGMAPRSTIGAASPVGPGGEDLPETINRKITEDLSATARNYAERRGKKAVEWAEDAVRDAKSATADEALKLGVIDALASSPEDFLEAVDGLEVEVAGQTRRLELSGARILNIPPSGAERLLGLLINPALALILLTLGVNAILAELSNPGGYVAGIIGVLALGLGLFSLGALEANWIGLAFMAAAFIFFALEIKTPTLGFLTAGGLILFVAGAVILFSGGQYAVPWKTILGLGLATAGFFFFVVRAALNAMRRQPTTGAEALIGALGELRRLPEDGRPGTVLVAGERWDAVLGETDGGLSRPAGAEVTHSSEAAASPKDIDGPETALALGQQVQILAREGFRLIVGRPRPEDR